MDDAKKERLEKLRGELEEDERMLYSWRFSLFTIVYIAAFLPALIYSWYKLIEHLLS